MAGKKSLFSFYSWLSRWTPVVVSSDTPLRSAVSFLNRLLSSWISLRIIPIRIFSSYEGARDGSGSYPVWANLI